MNDDATGRGSRNIISGKAVAGYVLFVSGVALLFTLGCWQLFRGLEKADLQEQLARGATRMISLEAAPEDWNTLQFSTVTLRGKWLADRTLLMENRLVSGRPGVEVLTPFALAGDGSILLVNRGWLAKPGIDQYAAVPPPRNAQAVEGQITLPRKGFTLGQTYQQPVSWPLPILYYDFSALAEAIGTPIQPASLVLSSSSPHSFQRIWAATNMPPSRHYGYAAQWWGLTLTLLVFGIVWRRIGRRTQDINNQPKS